MHTKKSRVVAAISAMVLSQAMVGPALADDPMQQYYDCVNSAYSYKYAGLEECAASYSNSDLRQYCERDIYSIFEAMIISCEVYIDPGE